MNSELTTIEPFLSNDFRVIRTTRRAAGSGTWVIGTVAGHRFNALVFPEHAENPDWEFGQSCISKFWLQRIADRTTVFEWDRGPSLPPADDLAEVIVDFLA